ncbi:MAG TPA: retroviral-like aspartic protease family protein [Steroidobacteraceae bacterium]|nr:retroviral-like aspartic protease family protein [Steroidobacteraceae bacterium]
MNRIHPLLLALALTAGLARTPALEAAPPAPQPQAPAPASPAPQAASPAGTPATPATPALPALPAPTSATPTPPGATGEPPLSEIVVQAPEPRFVAKTTRDRIGRIWAPVLIDGKGPFRLVLDTGANHSAVIPSTAATLGSPGAATATVVTGFTGSAVVPTISVDRMEVGDLLLGATTLPVVADVFGGAQGVLGNEGLAGKRILADFSHDRLEIATSHGEPAHVGFSVVHLKIVEGGLLLADIKVGGIHCKAIIDTGAQGTVGNLPLQEALMRHPPRNTKRAQVEGVTLDVQTGENVPAPEIEMGGLTITGVHIIFGDMYLFQHWHMADKPVLLLGMDLLGSFDVLIIDYRMRELQIRLDRGSL